MILPGIHLCEKCLLVIIILISVLIHLCIIFPVVFIHALNVTLYILKRPA